MNKVYLAADSGGTKTVWVLLTEEGDKIYEMRTEGVAAVKEGILPVRDIVRKAAKRIQEYGIPEGIYLSLGGPNVEEVSSALCECWDDIPVKVEREANGNAILYAASFLDCSAVVMCGTGSTAVGDTKDGRVYSGGWGPIYGDGGSGGGMGSAALKLFLRSVDGMADIGEMETLFDHLKKDLNVKEFGGRMELKARALNISRRELAGLAPDIYRMAQNGNAAAKRLIDDAAREIALMAKGVSEDREGFGVLLCGGFFKLGSDFVEKCFEKFRKLSKANIYYYPEFSPMIAAEIMVLKEHSVKVTKELFDKLLKG